MPAGELAGEVSGERCQRPRGEGVWRRCQRPRHCRSRPDCRQGRALPEACFLALGV